MKEIIKSFPKSSELLFNISLCGTSYCDGSYRVFRPHSLIHCFEYIISGTGTVSVNGQVFHPSAGDVYFLKAGDDHYYYSDAQDPWTKIWFNISGSLVDSLIEQYGISDIRLFGDCDARALFEEFIDNANRSDDIKTIKSRNAITLHRIIQCMSECIKSGESEYPEDALRLRDYIDKNYQCRISISELGALIYRSDSQTTRIFKKNFGMTPYEYSLKLRMQAACQLLRNTRMSVKEISASLGFSNEHYFSSCFKERVGFTPMQYRRR